MRAGRWVYVVVVGVAALLGVAIAGIPSRAHDAPVRSLVTTTTTTAAPPVTSPPTAAPTTPPPSTTTSTPARRGR